MNEKLYGIIDKRGDFMNDFFNEEEKSELNENSEMIVTESPENSEVVTAPEYNEEKEFQAEQKRSIFGISAYLIVSYVISILAQMIILFALKVIYPGLTEEYKNLVSQLDALKATGTAEEIALIQDQMYHCMFYIKAIAWTNIITSTVLFIATVIIFFKPLKKQLLDKSVNKLAVFFTGVIGFFILIAASMVTSAICSLFSQTDNSLNQMTIELICKNGYLIPMFFLTVIFAPISEELVFRKSVFGLFKNKWVGLVVSSIGFGLIHVLGGGDYIYLISYAASGFVLGGIYLYSNKNIYASIIAHMINNGFSFIMIVMMMLFPGIA